MGKRVTLITTRQDPSTPWFHETAQGSSVEQAVSEEQTFLMSNYETVSFNRTSTDTTLTLTLDFADPAIFDQYAALIVNNLESPYRTYCDANNMTVSRDITDI